MAVDVLEGLLEEDDEVVQVSNEINDFALKSFVSSKPVTFTTLTHSHTDRSAVRSVEPIQTHPHTDGITFGIRWHLVPCQGLLVLPSAGVMNQTPVIFLLYYSFLGVNMLEILSEMFP